jgi:DNA invertase Pin-like site-specific DNA recombinase
VKFGYTRVSTRGQARTGYSLQAQRDVLMQSGVNEANIFEDAGVSGAKRSRPALDEMLSKLRPDDEVIVPTLSRLGRNLTDLMRLVETLSKQQVTVRFLSESIDTSSATGRMMIGIFGAVAEMEREQIAERTALGRERSKALGRTGGRPKKYGAETLKGVARMEENSGLTVKQRAAALGIPLASYYVLRKQAV